MENEKTILDELEKKDDKYLLKLHKPIKYGEEIVDRLELDEPKAKHMRSLPSKPTTDDILKVIGKLVARPDSFIDELSLKDVAKLSEFIEVFS